MKTKLLIPFAAIAACAVARQDAAPPEAGRNLGGAASSRAMGNGARLEVAPPRRGNTGHGQGGQG